MRRRCWSDKCARSCSCICPRCCQLAASLLPPGATWQGRRGSAAGSRLAAHSLRMRIHFRGAAEARGIARELAMRWTTTVMAPPPMARELVGAMRRAALHATHVAASRPRHTRTHGCSLVRDAAATRGRDGTPSLQGRTSNDTRQMPQPLLARRACARARHPCPLRPARAALERQREWRLTNNGAGHAQQTQLRSRAPGAFSAPLGVGGPRQPRTASRRAPSCAALRALWGQCGMTHPKYVFGTRPCTCPPKSVTFKGLIPRILRTTNFDKEA